MKTKRVLLLAIAPLFVANTLLPTATAASVVTLNAASLASGAVAPGSIVSIFGANLAASTASAPDAANPPQTLAGVQVNVGGSAASLFFVSPFQINAVLAATTPAGNQAVTITSSAGTQTGALTVDPNATPGLFSTLGTGSGDGAILNALTFKGGAFSTVTSGNPTFLALFATGLNLTVTPTVTVGGMPATVTFSGKAPCCVGLDQINIQLPSTLAGAGRVPVVVQSGTQISNVVEIVILPPAGQGEFPGDQENQTRARETSAIAYIPGTSLALLSDENDDVVRVLDISQKKIVRVIALPDNAQPEGIAVSADGSFAVVAESNLREVAVINLKTFMVAGQVTVGTSPVAVTLAGATAFVVNQGSDTISLVNTSNLSLAGTVAVGHGPADIAVDMVAARLYVANQSEGSISVIDLNSHNVLSTVNVGAVRPSGIALTGVAGFVILADAASGNAEVLNLTTGAATQITAGLPQVNSVLVSGGTAYFAAQTGASVAILPLNISTAGILTGSATTVKAELGVRSLAVDTKDNLLLASNEGTGTVTLIDLTSLKLVGKIDAVKSSSNDSDDNSDHDNAPNVPTVSSVAPGTAKAGSTFTMTVTGQNLTGATDIIFVQPASLPGNGKGNGNGHNGNQGNGAFSAHDTAFTTAAVKVNAGGTQVTATVTIAAGAATGPRVVRVLTPNGDSSFVSAAANTFTVQ